MSVVDYLYTMAAGYASRVWRALRGKPCHCEHCEDRRRHAEEVAAYVDDERARGVPLTPVDLGGGKTLWTGDRDALKAEIDPEALKAAYLAAIEAHKRRGGGMQVLPTLDAARQERYR